MAFVMIAKVRPLSYNARHKIPYHARLREEALKQGVVSQSGSLYANIYYLHRGNRDTDADNICKPILDALCGLAYIDDRQVARRCATKVDLNSGTTISLDAVPPDILRPLLDAIADKEAADILIVEIGTLGVNVSIKFGEEAKADVHKERSAPTRSEG